MKKILTILAILITFFLVPSFTYATTATTVLNDIEVQRIKKLETQLGLTIPLVTDNPSHQFSFHDPSGKGVRLEIDGQGFKTIKSPYTLPALGIGKHILTFRFTDREEAVQILEESITVIPRPAVISAPERISTTEISLKGTALPASTVELYLSSGTKSFKASVAVANDGSWSHSFKSDFAYGIYNVVAVTKKTGIASGFSETLVFEISKSGSTTKPSAVKEIYFTFKSLISRNILTTLRNNTDLIIFSSILFVLGLAVATMYHLLTSHKKNRKLENVFTNLLDKKEKKEAEEKPENKPMTIKQKLELINQKKEESKVEEVKEVVEQKTDTPNEEKVVSKEEFLEEFKEKDPDNEKGEEKEVKEEKKDDKKKLDMKVSLTSKK